MNNISSSMIKEQIINCDNKYFAIGTIQYCCNHEFFQCDSVICNKILIKK